MNLNRFFLCRQTLPVLLIFLLPFSKTQSQEVIAYTPEVTKILFLLDGSGSMKEQWQNKSKFETAKELLLHIIDSLEQTETRVEFGVRIFGHQFPRAMNNCYDSELEVRFAKKNLTKIAQVLDDITPQGHSPIAYSLFLAAHDFADDIRATNAIILITDGKENCDGDPCAASHLLEKKRIALRPFIIGINIEHETASAFDCVGRFFDTKDEETFNQVIDVVVSQALNSTTAQVNLLDNEEKPTITNLEFSLYDHYSGEVRYNFVHTLTEEGNPDTLYLDPVGKYDIEVHTIPPVWKRGIELNPGKHNLIGVAVPQGTIDLHTQSSKGISTFQSIVREANSPDILHIQDMNVAEKYLSGDFDLEIMTLPVINENSIHSPAEETQEIVIPLNGTLSIVIREPAIASVYQVNAEILTMVYEFDKLGTGESLKLQPGEYDVVYRPLNAAKADLTKTKRVLIQSGKNTVVRL